MVSEAEIFIPPVVLGPHTYLKTEGSRTKRVLRTLITVAPHPSRFPLLAHHSLHSCVHLTLQLGLPGFSSARSRFLHARSIGNMVYFIIIYHLNPLTTNPRSPRLPVQLCTTPIPSFPLFFYAASPCCYNIIAGGLIAHLYYVALVETWANTIGVPRSLPIEWGTLLCQTLQLEIIASRTAL